MKADQMFQNETRVLVILPRDLVDRARVLAGRATTSMRLPVSLQIVLRALIEEGLRRPTDPGLLANVSRQDEPTHRWSAGMILASVVPFVTISLTRVAVIAADVD